MTGSTGCVCVCVQTLANAAGSQLKQDLSKLVFCRHTCAHTHTHALYHTLTHRSLWIEFQIKWERKWFGIFFWINKYFKASRWNWFSHYRGAQALLRHQAVCEHACVCVCIYERTVLSGCGWFKEFFPPLVFKSVRMIKMQRNNNKHEINSYIHIHV